MSQSLALVTFLVREYDEAIAWFQAALGWHLLEDTDMGGDKRWVRMATSADAPTAFLIARATTKAQRAAVGQQTGGRVGFFLHVEDFAAAHARMTAAGVHFREAARHEPYGIVAVFEDLYGQPWDLIEPGATGTPQPRT